MPRPDIAMTTAEVEAFLAGRCQMVIGAVDADGWPLGTIAEVDYHGGRVTARLAVGDVVGTALATDPRVCCVADEHDSYHEIKGVIVHGRRRPAGSDVDDGALTIEIDRVISFDFGRLP